MSDPGDSPPTAKARALEVLRPPPASPVRRVIAIQWMRAKIAVSTPSNWGRALISIAQVALFCWPLLLTKLRVGAATALLAIFLQVVKTWRDSDPAHMQTVRRGSREREMRLYLLLQDMQRDPPLNADGIYRFRQEALSLIASFVRDHRLDLDASEIFANLLIEDGNNLRVIARDLRNQRVLASYPKDGMLAWETICSGENRSTGDVYHDYPSTPPGKKYHSILTIPVKRGAGKPKAVVSIDSVKRHRFDLEHEEISASLLPYIALIAWTFGPPTTKLLSAEEPEQNA